VVILSPSDGLGCYHVTSNLRGARSRKSPGRLQEDTRDIYYVEDEDRWAIAMDKREV
jgi:hypothetical protein